MKRLTKLFISLLILSVGFTSCAGKKSKTNAKTKTQTEKAKKEGETMHLLKIPNPQVQDGIIFTRLFRPEGDGKFPLIITSHGYNGCNTDFAEDCKFYSKNGFAALSYDFAGGSTRSQSTGKSTDMTLLTEKENLLAVIDYFSQQDYIDADNIILMGGSQGGLVSSLVADEIPDRIKALALYYPAFCIPDNWRDNFPEGSEIPETMNFWGLDLGKKFFEVAREMHVEDCTGKYAGPVLIIHGTEDNIVPLSYAQDAQKRFPNAQLEIFEGEGHGFSPQAGYKARDLVLAHAKKALEL